jgi:hypothetical protein
MNREVWMDHEFYAPSYCLRNSYWACHGDGGYVNVNQLTIKTRQILLAWPPNLFIYEGVSKIFRTGAVIDTAVVILYRICPNGPNCEFRVLLRRFAATAWRLAKTSPWTSARTDLAASPWRRPVSHFFPHPVVPGAIKMAVTPHPPYSPDLVHCDFFIFPKMKLKLKGRRFYTIEERSRPNRTVLDILTERDF